MKRITIISAILLLFVSSNSFASCYNDFHELKTAHGRFESGFRAVQDNFRQECIWTLKEVHEKGKCAFYKEKLRMVDDIDLKIARVNFDAVLYLGRLRDIKQSCLKMTVDERKESIESFNKLRQEASIILSADSDICREAITKQSGGACETLTNK